MYKGHNCASVKVHSEEKSTFINWNEFKTFVDMRYVFAPVAAHRILNFVLSDRTDFINRLPVSLPNAHMIYYETGKEEKAFNANKGTKLTDWF